MKNLKNVFVIGVLLIAIAGLSTPVFASTREEIPTTQETIILRDVVLIEDNGDPYVEIIIGEDEMLSRASGGTHSTTYDMTGGVFTKQTWNCSNAPTFVVRVIPKTFDGNMDSDMSIYLERKSGLMWTGADAADTSMVYPGRVTLKGSQAGNYRLYFRNWTGFRATGDIEISYSY